MWKYLVLQHLRQHVRLPLHTLHSRAIIPLNIAVIFSLGRELSIQLDTQKPTGLAPDASNKAHSSIHVPRNIDGIADFQALSNIPYTTRCRRGHGAVQSVQ